jgi:hypothetical protein
MHFIVNRWILGEHADREWVSNGGGVDLIKAQYIPTWSTKVKPPWTINIFLINKMKGRRGGTSGKE